jgi:type IV pilus assembly protein PilF
MSAIARIAVATVATALTVVAAGCASSDALGRTSPKQASKYNTQLGVEYLQQGNLAQAKEKLDRAVEQDPGSAMAHAASGLLYDRLGDDRAADQQFARAVSLEPDNSDILNNYAVFLCRKGDAERGKKMFLKAAANPLYRTPEVAYVNAAKCVRDGGDLAGADELLRHALAAKPTFADALLQMSSVQYALGNHLPARGFLERYFGTGQSSAEALLLGVRIEKALGDASGADEYATRLKNEYPTSVQTEELLKAERSGA